MEASSLLTEKIVSVCHLNITRFLLSLAAILLAYSWYKRPRNFPPGPRGFPIVGVLPHINASFRPRVFRSWSKSYGPVVGAALPTRHLVVLNDFDVIQEALVKNKEDFSSRPVHPFVEEFVQGILFLPYGKHWETMRKFGLNTMRGYGMGKKSMEARIQEELGYLNAAIEQQGGKAFDMQIQKTNAVSNIICSIVFGQRFEYDDPHFKGILEAFSESLSSPTIIQGLRIVRFFPFLSKVFAISKPINNFRRVTKEMFDFVSDIISNHEKTFDATSLRDVIDAYVDDMKKGKSGFTEKHLLHYIRELFMAGTETTTTTLRWAALVFLHYPDIQEKLYEEIFSVLGADGVVSMTHKEELQYTQAFIEELYRFRTIVPLALPHCTSRDTYLRGYFIPKNTVVQANLWAVHNDPELFPQPDLFKPERHLDSQSRFVKSRHVIPFSVGPRHCLGEQLARMEVFMFLVNLVQKFEFLPDPDARELPDLEKGAMFGPIYAPPVHQLVAKMR